MFRLATNEMVAEAAILALLIVVIGVLPVILLERLSTMRRRIALVPLAPADPELAA